MSEYILKVPTQNNDAAPPFIQRAMTWAKATNEITGLIRGILCDGVVAESEAVFLRKWIGERPELLCDPLVASLAARLQRVFADGIVTLEELEELKAVLLQFDPQDQTPTTLPLDNPPPSVTVSKKSFCFTGTFVSGKRSWCEMQVTERGGEAHDNIRTDTSFLVIGSKVSAAWVNQSYGRKIQAAAQAKQNGAAICLINEEHWLNALQTVR
jgi:hypothetical protein